MSLGIRLCCLLATGLALSACSSTVDSARKLSAQGTAAFSQKGVVVGTIDRRLRIMGTALVTDANGTAVIVTLRNSGSEAIANAPIAIDVRGQGGATVFRNDAPGLEQDLAHVPLLLPHHAFDWINDQILASGTPARASVRIGAGVPAPSSLPALKVSSVVVTNDPASGLVATGRVQNASTVDQRHLVLFAVGRRAGRIVTAGRAILPRLLAGKSLSFHAYLIGNPKGARISVSAPPSVLR